MPKQISLSNCSVVLKYSNSRYLERFVICCSFMKSLGGSQNHTICIRPLVHGLSFQLQVAVIVLFFIERHIEGFHGEASQARTRLSDLVDSYGIPVGFVCSVLGEACQKAGSKGNVKGNSQKSSIFLISNLFVLVRGSAFPVWSAFQVLFLKSNIFRFFRNKTFINSWFGSISSSSVWFQSICADLFLKRGKHHWS